VAGRQIGWGFVGTSGWVGSRFAPAVQAAGHRVAGGFGSSAESSAKFAERFGASPYHDLNEMLADDAVEAVWIASPTALHPEHAQAVAAAGKPMLLEKPVAATAAAARQLAAGLAGTPVLVAAGFQHRFNPAVAAVADTLAKGQVGTLSSLVIQHSIAGPAAPTAWRADPASGGWAIADLGAHLLDIAGFLLPGARFWAARLTSPSRGLPVDDESWVLLARGEVTVVIRAATGAVGPASFIEAIGSEGWVRAAGFWVGTARVTDSAGRDEELPAADLYAAQVAAFSGAVAGAEWKGATLADGVRVSELMGDAWEFTRERAAAAG
jgi:predicted dehydrogenase